MAFLFLVGVLFAACQSAVREEMPPADRITFEQDSATITACFKLALQQPQLSDSLLAQARHLSQKDTSLKDVFRFQSIRNTILKGELDKAEQALHHFLDPHTAVSSNPALAKYFNLLASVAAFKNDPETAIIYYKKALQLYDESGDDLHASAVRFNLANIFLSRTDYPTAHAYTKEAHGKLTQLGDTQYLLLTKALLAVTALHVNDMSLRGTPLAEEALALAERYQNVQGILMAWYAIGETAMSYGEFKDAIEPLNKAIAMGTQYGQAQIVLAGRAALVVSYLALSQFDAAIEEGEKALRMAGAAGNKDITYSLKKNLAKAYAQTGQYPPAYQYLSEAEAAYREKSNKENQEVTQDLLIRYETEKKSKTILKQEARLQEKRTWITVLTASVVVSLAALIFFRLFFLQRHRAQRTQKEKDILLALTEGEELERERLAAELHDGIASQLTVLRLLLENEKDPLARQDALMMLRQVHREVRMAAHNLMPVDFSKVSLARALEEFCLQSNTPQLPVRFFSNAPYTMIPRHSAHVVYRVTQELVQNAMKHARAGGIFVQCLLAGQEYQISIEDDGCGMDPGQEAAQKSIRYLTDRLQKLDASFDFQSAVEQGTLIVIRLKVSPAYENSYRRRSPAYH